MIFKEALQAAGKATAAIKRAVAAAGKSTSASKEPPKGPGKGRGHQKQAGRKSPRPLNKAAAAAKDIKGAARAICKAAAILRETIDSLGRPARPLKRRRQKAAEATGGRRKEPEKTARPLSETAKATGAAEERPGKGRARRGR